MTDTLLLMNGWGLKVVVQTGSFYTFFENEPAETFALIYSALRQAGYPLADLFAPGKEKEQEKIIEIGEIVVPDVAIQDKEEVSLLGSAKFLQTQGISTAPGALKARRLATLGEIPLFLARAAGWPPWPGLNTGWPRRQAPPWKN